MSSVYLSGPLAECTESEALGWRLVAKSLLPDFDCIDPADNWFRGDYSRLSEEEQVELVTRDLQDIDRSDALLVNPWKPSYGTPMEICYGCIWRKPVVVVWPRYTPSPWLSRHATKLVRTVEEGCEWLRKNVK